MKPHGWWTHNMTKNDKEDFDIQLLGFLDYINKEYGDGVNVGSNLGTIKQEDIIPSGIVSLDFAAGNGGFVRGRLVDIYGPEASGKSLVAFHLIGHNLKLGRRCLIIDAEGTTNSSFMKMLGIDIENENLVIMRSGETPLYAEDWFEILKKALDAKEFDIVLVDSVPALVPKSIAEGDMNETKQRAILAQIMSEGLSSIIQRAVSAKTLLIFINQLRARPTVMFGNPMTPTGGNAIKFFASYRIAVKPLEDVKKAIMLGTKKLESIIGYRVRYTFEKNKLAPANTSAEFYVDFRDGVDYVDDLISCAELTGVIGKSGSSYWFYPNVEGSEKVNGRDKFKEWLQEKDLVAALTTDVKHALQPKKQ